MKVCAFTQGENVSSARFRIRQYIPYVEKKGIKIDEFISKSTSYPPYSKIQRPLWGVKTLLERAPYIIESHKYDIVLLQRTFISKFPTFEKLTKSPRILDVDDAIWVRNKSLSSKLAKNVNGIICGNEFLAEEYIKYNRNIEIVPTAVDTNRFIPIEDKFNNSQFIIGWSGTSSGLKYIYDIESALNYLLNKYKHVKLRIVSDKEPKFKLIKPNNYEFIRWTPQNEVNTIQTMDVGIMPLEDNIFEKGKCSYKMLLYMSCGIPVVVSEIGMNKEVLSKGNIGYGANNIDEWIYALEELIENSSVRNNMGINGRMVVTRNYSIEAISDKLIEIIRKYK